MMCGSSLSSPREDPSGNTSGYMVMSKLVPGPSLPSDKHWACNLIPRPSMAPVFDHLQYAYCQQSKTGQWRRPGNKATGFGYIRGIIIVWFQAQPSYCK